MSHFDSLEPRQLFTGGAYDNTFGLGSSVAHVSFAVNKTNHETATLTKVVSDSGGRTYVLATTAANSFADKTTLQIRRLTAAGALDAGWVKAKSNNAVFPLDSTLQAYKGHLQIDAFVDSSDRLTLLLGTKVYRFTVGGTLDNTFGKKGVATLTGMTSSAAMTTDTAGHIYVVGTQAADAQFGQAVIDRLTADGQADTTFQKTGSYAIPKYAPKNSTEVTSNAVAVRVLADGSVVVMSAASYFITTNDKPTYTGTLTEKFTAAGAVDTTYGTNGIGTDFGRGFPGDYEFDEADPVGIRSDGSVVIDHHSADEMTSSAHNEVLSPDGTYFKTARLGPTKNFILAASTTDDHPVQFITQADGTELVVAPSVGLYRLTKNGSYDTTFNDGQPIDGVQSAAFQQDKTVVIASEPVTGPSVTVQRVFRDNNPVATLIAKPLTSKADTYGFSVLFRGALSMQSTSTTPNGAIAANGIRITASNGRYRYATLLGYQLLADHSLLAKYQLTDFAGGAWDASNNGTYSVTVLDGAAHDENGNGVQRRVLGNLTVAIT